MFIVWGKKLVYRKVGHVADFCPICRKPSSFELQRVGSAGHIYYISAGEGELVGHERRCSVCSTTFHAQPSVYASVSKTAAPLPDLIAKTFPNLHVLLKERLALEQRVQSQPATLSRDERHALIRNPFLLLSPKVEKRYAATHLDLEIGLSFLAAVLLLIFGASAVRVVAPDHAEQSALVFAVLGILLVGWQFVQSGRRFMRREIVPVLAKSLAPLKPTRAELQTVSNELRQLRHKIGSKLRLADLEERLSMNLSTARRDPQL